MRRPWCKLFNDQSIAHGVKPRAAVLFRDGNPHEPEAGHFLHGIPGEGHGFIQFLGVWFKLLSEQTPALRVGQVSAVWLIESP